MANLPPFKNGTDEHHKEYFEIFDENISSYKILRDKVVEKFFPGKSWIDLQREDKEMCGHFTNAMMFETMDDFRQRHPDLFLN